MKQIATMIGTLALLCSAAAAGAEEKQKTADDTIVWGKAVGLQLGISPPMKAKWKQEAMYEGGNLHVEVYLRNTGKQPIRLLPSIHQCVAVGPNAALYATRLHLLPAQGGRPLTVTYQGHNHLRLLDKRHSSARPTSERFEEHRVRTSDIELTAEQADYLMTELAPGKTSRATNVTFSLKPDSKLSWRLTGQHAVPAETYHLVAVLVLDQKRSPWQGTLTSGPLDIKISGKKGD